MYMSYIQWIRCDMIICHCRILHIYYLYASESLEVRTSGLVQVLPFWKGIGNPHGRLQQEFCVIHSMNLHTVQVEVTNPPCPRDTSKGRPLWKTRPTFARSAGSGCTAPPPRRTKKAPRTECMWPEVPLLAGNMRLKMSQVLPAVHSVISHSKEQSHHLFLKA